MVPARDVERPERVTEVTNAGVYLRVSTGRQDEANQEPDCARLCAARGWTPVYYREQESGAKQRPEWRRLIEAARTGHLGAVVFWALDRTGRNRAQICRDVEALGHYNVHLASVQDAWLDQPAGPFRDLMLQVVAWFAEGERRRLIDRTKAGLARARLLGKTLGRPPASARAVAEGKMLIAQGVPLAEAARRSGLARSTLQDYVRQARRPVPKNGAR